MRGQTETCAYREVGKKNRAFMLQAQYSGIETPILAQIFRLAEGYALRYKIQPGAVMSASTINVSFTPG
jgi:hypothetical protein